MKRELNFIVSAFILIMLTQTGCRKAPAPAEEIRAEISDTVPKALPARPLSGDFKKYWYSGVAELNSYELEQARYGELRDGEAVLIYVTEPFDLEKQVKADLPGEKSTSVLKLNRVRKFMTGVYPYSIMSSIFYPVSDNQHALKVTTSVQEWCGHAYTQVNRGEEFEIVSHSYFEAEADQNLSLPLTLLEDELWTRIRFEPDALPAGDMEVIPSLEYLRLKHKPIKSYKATGTLSEPGETRTYTLTYPGLNRTLQIHFEGTFPYRIEGWTETFQAGFRTGSGMITSTAKRKKTLMTPYWQKNSREDESLRDSLGLRLK